jgi:glycosyltransferase involved in cell wall biosynthesis
MSEPTVGVVIIGRNEGERLARCLASVAGTAHCVYVDSGSTDGSVALARARGVAVVELGIPPPFTAARARNAGLQQLLSDHPELQLVQLVDGDCEVQPGWTSAAVGALQAEPRLAAVCGRRRERFPAASVYNALCDDEWNLPLGPALMFGGDVMLRVSALRQVEFYSPRMIAGEEPDLAARLHKAGWLLRVLPVEMTLHDANITRLSQWWQRMRRAGYAYAELAVLHGDLPETGYARALRRISIWGCVVPSLCAVTIAAAFFDRRWLLATAVLLLLWTVNLTRIALRERARGLGWKLACASALSLTAGKVAQFLGVWRYWHNRRLAREATLIEYKRPGT